jgi:hypothetical protein
MPPASASAIAISASVTTPSLNKVRRARTHNVPVSIGELTNGVRSFMFLLTLVDSST